MRALKRCLMTAMAVLCISVLAGCGAIPGNKQVNAGITHATVELDVAATENGNVIYVKTAEIIDGKDKQGVKLAINAPGGWSVNYDATGVQAVDAIRVRGAVEESISEDLKEAVPGIVDAIIEKLTGGAAP